MAAALEVTLEQFQRWLDERATTVRQGQLSLKAAWPRVSLLLTAQTRRSFAEGRTPEGTPWAPLKRPSKRSGGPSAKPLRDRGLLMASTGQGGANHVEQQTDTLFVFGTNVAYSSFHQHGTAHIPARPFLGITPATADKVVLILQEVAAKELLK